MELVQKCLFVVLLWILWCTFHSALIATTVTDTIKKKLGDKFKFYRFFYNIFFLATLIPLIYYSVSVREAPVFQWEGTLVILKYLLLFLSLFLFISGARHYSMALFLGIRQIKTGRMKQTLSEDHIFDTSGILGVIRHPWYTAGIMIIWTRDISASTFLINIVISVYFIIGAILEERKLELEFGEKYREYRKNVSMLFPYQALRRLF